MTASVSNTATAIVLVGLGLAIAAMGLYVANADDAPGAAGMGFLLMLGAVVLAMRTARNRLPAWARRTALLAGAALAAFAALLTHHVTVAAPLFTTPTDVPSISQPAPPPQWAAAVDRARAMTVAAISAQNLPGVSIAVGVGDHVVWAEGFGWRDVVTHTPMTPDTRFVIGSAAPMLTTDAVASLGLANTGTEDTKPWSPEAIGEEGEDFPPLTILRHTVFQPLGLMPMEYPLPDNRATFYVPRSDDHDTRRGRRLMYMRDLACCAGGQAFYSTPSDLVRFALATKADSVDGDLAGGRVVSLVTRAEGDVAVAVASNMAFADTNAIAAHIADVFSAR